jgi:hypothetical protein
MIACILPLTGSLQLQACLAMGMPPNATPRAFSLSTPGSPVSGSVSTPLTCPPEMFPIFGRVCFSRGRTNETQQV